MISETDNPQKTVNETENFSVSQILDGHVPNANSDTSHDPFVESSDPQKKDEAPTDDVEISKTKDEGIQESDVLEYLKSKGKDVESIDDLFKEKEEGDYVSLLSDEEKQFLDFKKQTGGTKEDFDFQNKNWDEASISELIKIKTERESGLNLNDQEVEEYIEDVLGIVSDLDNLTIKEKVKLNSFLKEIKDTLKSEQSEVSKNLNKKDNIDGDVMVTLDNGITMPKKDYDAQLKQRENFLMKNKEAVNSVTEFPFSIEISEEGKEKKSLDFSFEISEKDKQSMLSISNDVSEYVSRTYGVGEEFKQKEFNADLFWLSPSNRQKAISSLLHQARAQAIEEVMKNVGNVNLKNNPPLDSSKQKEGVKYVRPGDLIGM